MNEFPVALLPQRLREDCAARTAALYYWCAWHVWSLKGWSARQFYRPEILKYRRNLNVELRAENLKLAEVSRYAASIRRHAVRYTYKGELRDEIVSSFFHPDCELSISVDSDHIVDPSLDIGDLTQLPCTWQIELSLRVWRYHGIVQVIVQSKSTHPEVLIEAIDQYCESLAGAGASSRVEFPVLLASDGAALRLESEESLCMSVRSMIIGARIIDRWKNTSVDFGE